MTVTDPASDAIVERRDPVGGRWPLLLPILLVVLLALVLDQSASNAGAGGVRHASFAGVPTVAPTGTVAAAWYCAEGTSNPGGRADETVIIANLSSGPTTADVQVVGGARPAMVTKPVQVAPYSQVRVHIADLLVTAEPGVIVQTYSRSVVVEHELRTGAELATGPCAREPATSWDFATGSTGKGEQLFLALFNPFPDDAVVDVGFVSDTSPEAPGPLQGLVVPRRSRVTIPVNDQLDRRAVLAAHVEVRSGRVVAESSQVHNTADGRKGIAASLGVTRGAGVWTFPYGDAKPGIQDAIAIANFGTTPARVSLETRLPGVITLSPRQLNVPAQTVVVANAAERVPLGTGFSTVIRVLSGGPVVAEQLAAFKAPARTTGIAAALGVPQPARWWAFAAGRVTAADDELIVDNPGRRAARLDVEVLSGGNRIRPPALQHLAVPAGKHVRFALSAGIVPADAAVVVRADHPVDVVRAGFAPTGVTISPGIVWPA